MAGNSVADLDPLHCELTGFVASEPVWHNPVGQSSQKARRKGGILYSDKLPFRMQLELRFDDSVAIVGTFQHLAKGNWRDVYVCHELGLVVKILEEKEAVQSRSEYDQRGALHGCAAPVYGRCTGMLFDHSMHLLVAAYVGVSLDT
jgi:hypothetical protein